MSKYLTLEGFQRFASGLSSKLGGQIGEVITSGSFNDIKTPGIYIIKGITANAPTSWGYHSLLVMKSDSNDFIHQIAIKESMVDAYIRYCKGGHWSAWTKFVTHSDSASSAYMLATPRKIAGHDFDGTADITITAEDVGAQCKYAYDRVPQDYMSKVRSMIGLDPEQWMHYIDTYRTNIQGCANLRSYQSAFFAVLEIRICGLLHIMLIRMHLLELGSMIL